MDPFSEIINKECVFFINNETYLQNENSRYWELNKLNFFLLYEQITILFFHFCIQEKHFWLIDSLYIFYKLSVLFSLSAYSYI